MLRNLSTSTAARIMGVLSVFLLSACATQTPPTLQGRCVTATFMLDAPFAGGGMAGCRIVNDNHIEVVVAPEDVPINPSPWYAVRLTPSAAGEVVVSLIYTHAKHRYRPKLIGQDGTWEYVNDSNVVPQRGGKKVRIALSLDQQSLILAGQEILNAGDYEQWMTAHAAKDHITRSEIGRSVQNRPIHMLATDAPGSHGTVVLVGRQHPPELTGAVAMLPFVDEVFGASELATAFRRVFDVVAVPLMNPDGVTLGYWRHNVNGVDLNRDWGPFTQPETTSVLRVLDQLAARPDAAPVVFLDFHSTQRNVFYTQLIGADGTPHGFTAQWLARSRARLPDYSFERAERNQTTLATSKNYVHGRFAIPAITYEVGDETDRSATVRAARVFAQEMMGILLEEHDATNMP
jgi:predicted deacylase